MRLDDLGAAPAAAAMAIDQPGWPHGPNAGGDTTSPIPFTLGADGMSAIVRLTTAAAYRNHPAKDIVADLARHVSLDADLTQRMEPALHEALANAVMRGNLEMAKPRHNGLDGYVEQELLINRLLTQRPDLGLRPVTIAMRWTAAEIEISVQDEGQGYPARPG